MDSNTMNVKLLAAVWQSKKEIYKILQVEGGIYLPSLEQTNYWFVSRRIRSERAFDSGNRSYTGERAIFDLLSSSALQEHDRSLVFQLYIGSTNPSDPHTLLVRQIYSTHLSYLFLLLFFSFKRPSHSRSSCWWARACCHPFIIKNYLILTGLRFNHHQSLICFPNCNKRKICKLSSV